MQAAFEGRDAHCGVPVRVGVVLFSTFFRVCEAGALKGEGKRDPFLGFC